jgi:hypothetical protein
VHDPSGSCYILVIASEAWQSHWIASSLALLAMTGREREIYPPLVAEDKPRRYVSNRRHYIFVIASRRRGNLGGALRLILR